MKRNKNDESLKEVINRLWEAYGFTEKMISIQVVNSWEKMMGEQIAKRTRDIQLKNKVLSVTVNSSVLANELMMARKKVAQMINQEIGKRVVEEVKIMS